MAEVLVVIGVGGMGRAIAHRCGAGRVVVLADVTDEGVQAVAAELADEGHTVHSQRIDVADPTSMQGLATFAASLGAVRAIAHTAGVSPVQAESPTVLAVDLLGVAHMLDAFEAVVAPGGAAVVISSMSAHLVPPLGADDVQALASTPAAGLLGLPVCRDAAAADPGLAYSFAKQATLVRVKAASVAWGRRGARVNTISPGIIATKMGQAELAGPSGEFMRLMVSSSGTGRLGTADDIAAATELLLGPAASFITGADLLVDGGAVAALQTGQLAVDAADT